MILRTLSDRTTVTRRQRQTPVGWRWREGWRAGSGGRLTLILSDVLEGKGQAGVLALDDADLAKGSLADDTQQAKVIEVHWGELVSGCFGGGRGSDGCDVGESGCIPWSVKTTGFPLL